MTSHSSKAGLHAQSVLTAPRRDPETPDRRGSPTAAGRPNAPRSSEPHVTATAETPYNTGWEHLQDELQRLRLRLLLHLRTKRGGQHDGRLDGFQGLVISEQEVADLLHDLRPKEE